MGREEVEIEEKEVKKEYDYLISLGEAEFSEMFPFLTGDWSTDKAEFINIYKMNKDLNM